MGGKASRRKGYIGEKEFRDLCAESELKCVWTNEDPDEADVRVNGMKTEIKYRKTVPKSCYDWLNQDKSDLLAMRRIGTKAGDKGNEWLMVMPFHVFRDMQHRIFELETMIEIEREMNADL